ERRAPSPRAPRGSPPVTRPPSVQGGGRARHPASTSPGLACDRSHPRRTLRRLDGRGSNLLLAELRMARDGRALERRDQVLRSHHPPEDPVHKEQGGIVVATNRLSDTILDEQTAVVTEERVSERGLDA